MQLVLTNAQVATILERAPDLNMPDWWLTGGALFQTVWNVLAERPPTAGIRDYDLFYFDAADRSEAAELDVRRRASKRFGDLGVPVEICNEARVHLWYEASFGVPARRFTDSRDAINHFASTSAFGISRDASGALVVHAPFGFADLFARIVRANPRLAPREVYENKAERWRREWPALDVRPWTDERPPLMTAEPGAAAGSARTRRSRARRPRA